jgi:hypothetical protein
MSEKVDLSLAKPGDTCQYPDGTWGVITAWHHGDGHPWWASRGADGKEYAHNREGRRDRVCQLEFDIICVLRDRKQVTPRPTHYVHADGTAEAFDKTAGPIPAKPAAEGDDRRITDVQRLEIARLDGVVASLSNETERLQRELDAAVAHSERNMNAIDLALGQPRYDDGCLLDAFLKRIHELKIIATRPFTPEEAARELLGDQIARAGECGHSYVIAITEQGVTTRLHGDVTYEELARAFLKDGSPCGVLIEA